MEKNNLLLGSVVATFLLILGTVSSKPGNSYSYVVVSAG